jgi:hypothetical protein
MQNDGTKRGRGCIFEIIAPGRVWALLNIVAEIEIH